MIAPYSFVAGEWTQDECNRLARRIGTWPLPGYLPTVPVLHVYKIRAHGKMQYGGEVLDQEVHSTVFNKWLDQIELLYLRAIRTEKEK